MGGTSCHPSPFFCILRSPCTPYPTALAATCLVSLLHRRLVTRRNRRRTLSDLGRLVDEYYVFHEYYPEVTAPQTIRGFVFSSQTCPSANQTEPGVSNDKHTCITHSDFSSRCNTSSTSLSWTSTIPATIRCGPTRARPPASWGIANCISGPEISGRQVKKVWSAIPARRLHVCTDSPIQTMPSMASASE